MEKDIVLYNTSARDRELGSGSIALIIRFTPCTPPALPALSLSKGTCRKVIRKAGEEGEKADNGWRHLFIQLTAHRRANYSADG